MIRIQTATKTLAIIATTLAVLTAVAADALPPAAKILDPDILFYSWPYPVISPDGQWVAYISKGFVCVCNVKDPQPRRLSEVPNTWTHVLAQPEYTYADGDWSTVARGLSREDYQKWVASVAHTVLGLQWTRESDGVIFAYQGYDADEKADVCDIRQATLDGTVSSLAKLPRGISHSTHPVDFYFTSDRRFLVIPGYERPLIWELTTNKPRATPFLILTPSPTSNRWIGVEKDTRQFVITDENFAITKRLDDEWPATSFGRDLLWSPDERFVIWRNQIGFDHYSNWEGCWLDLQTGKRRQLTGSFVSDIVAFTGRQGEFIRIGAEGKQGFASGLISTGAYFQVVPSDGDGPKVLWAVHFDPNNRSNSPVRFPDTRFIHFSPDFELFAFGLPRETGPVGQIAHLMDRTGQLWRLPGDDNMAFFSPYEVVGFAEGGKSLIAQDGKRLFLLPVSAMKIPENKTNLETHQRRN